MDTLTSFVGVLVTIFGLAMIFGALPTQIRRQRNEGKWLLTVWYPIFGCPAFYCRSLYDILIGAWGALLPDLAGAILFSILLWQYQKYDGSWKEVRVLFKKILKKKRRPS